ncbi:MAG: UDP-glucose:(heptosyl)LPS alpha,3-glucosyltransferase [Phycisphaerales bacterium]|nr:UDP-glucose:(heptosyl)LPS alpha,3-glucosyltransferase [Phycisphaerales bacterium]
MKIALVILHADESRGGAERYTTDLAVSLATRGHDIRVISTSFSDAIAPQLRVQLDAHSATRTGTYRKFLDLLDGHLANAKYDIVHAMLPVRTCDAYHPHAGIAAEMAQKWNVLFNPRRRAMAKVERQLLESKRPPMVLSLSEYVKTDIRRHFPALPADRLATLFNAVDLKKFDPAAAVGTVSPLSNVRADGRPYVWTALMVAQDFERKGLQQAIEALGKLHHAAPHRLVVVGDDFKAKYELLAKEQHVDVHFVGAVTDPRPYYRAADFVILPTRHDPCSLVVLEALAMGVPVISTRKNGATEIMTDGVHGHVIADPQDTDALVTAIRDVISPQRRAALREACLGLRPLLSHEHHLDQLEHIYQRAIRT